MLVRIVLDKLGRREHFGELLLYLIEYTSICCLIVLFNCDRERIRDEI